jgi:hypothetical protein
VAVLGSRPAELACLPWEFLYDAVEGVYVSSLDRHANKSAYIELTPCPSTNSDD